MIGKIEHLFKDDPLAFDELNIKENLKRWDKKRKLRFMNKTAEEIKKETIEKENQMKDHLENIVKKYKLFLALTCLIYAVISLSKTP